MTPAPASQPNMLFDEEMLRERAAVDLRTDKAEAADDVRPNAAAMRATDGNADDQVAHQVHDGVAAEVALRAEEARAPSEVRFTADDPRTHAASADADGRLAILDAAAECRPDPRRDESVRARLHRRQHHRCCRGKNERFDNSFHSVAP